MKYEIYKAIGSSHCRGKEGECERECGFNIITPDGDELELCRDCAGDFIIGRIAYEARGKFTVMELTNQ